VKISKIAGDIFSQIEVFGCFSEKETPNRLEGGLEK
jgi:hypothetical protein